MAQHKIGTPGAKDATARFERLVAQASEVAAKRIMSFGPLIVNRPVGSTTLTDDDIIEDYTSMLNDPTIVTERYIRRAAQVGENLALREIVEFSQRAQKLMEKKNDNSRMD